MFGSKYGNFLTVLLVIIIVAIIGLLIFFGYDSYRKYNIDKDAIDAIEKFENTIKQNNTIENNNNIVNNVTNEITNSTADLNQIISSLNQTTNNNNNNGNSNNSNNGSSSNGNGNSGSNNSNLYKGFVMKGYINIPKTNCTYPILEKVTTKSLEVSVGILYPEGSKLNVPGNISIAGHNYRNGLFFSNNKKLAIGDKVYITDEDNNKIEYTIYKKYETTPEDSDYMTRDTNGAREITLVTCTDDSQKRIVIWAKES